MVFSGDPAMRRSDLLAIVSVLDVDTVLDRAVQIGLERTGARAAALGLPDEGAYAGRHEEHAPSDRGDAVPLLLVTGIGYAEASALRARLGSAGLQGTPGDRAEQDLVRLRDPGTGEEVLRVPVVVGGTLFADLMLLGPDGHAFADDDVESVAMLGRVTGVAVRNALSYTLNERRRESLELGARVEQSVRPPFDLAEPMAHIAEGARRISGARCAAVVRATSHGIEVSATAGLVDDALPHLLDRTLTQVHAAQTEGREFTAHVGEATVWGLPLSSGHSFAGLVVLVMYRARSRRTAEDEELMTAFVRHSSLVLDHAVLQQERQHAVLAADRDRIARDLHDIVIQRLYATALKLRAGTRADGDHDEDLVAEAIRDIGDSIRDIRGTVFELERGRSASLRADALALAREYETVLGFVPVVRSWGPVDALVGPELGDQVTVVLRELLSNCARHARAGRCEVDVTVESGWFTLQVADDGRGMAESGNPRSGLRNVEARAVALGGEVVVEAPHPRGTRVRWRVPLRDQPASPGPTSGSVEESAAEDPAAGSAADSAEGTTAGSDQNHSAATVSSTQDSPTTTR